MFYFLNSIFYIKVIKRNKKTLYAHNNSIVVKVGDVVKKGQIISKVGSTGNSTGNHVHFELRINNKRINPIYGVTRDI